MEKEHYIIKMETLYLKVIGLMEKLKKMNNMKNISFI